MIDRIIISASLILIVLLQAGRGGGIAGLFGGGGSDQLFSAPSGMAFVKKVTVGMAILFVITSLSLTVVTARSGIRSVTEQIPYIPVEEPVSPVK